MSADRACRRREAPRTGVHGARDGIRRPGLAGERALFGTRDDVVVVGVVAKEVAEILPAGRRRDFEIELAADLVGHRRVVPCDGDLQRLRGVADVQRVGLAGRIGGVQVQSGAVDEAGRGRAAVAYDQPRNRPGIRLERKGVRQDDASKPLLAVAAELPGEAGAERKVRPGRVHPLGGCDEDCLDKGSGNGRHLLRGVAHVRVGAVGVEALREVVANEQRRAGSGRRREARRDLTRDHVALNGPVLVVVVRAAVKFRSESQRAGVGARGHEQGRDTVTEDRRGAVARIRPAAIRQVRIAEIVRVARSADGDDVLGRRGSADGVRIGNPVRVLVSSGVAGRDKYHGVAVRLQERIDLLLVAEVISRGDRTPREVDHASTLGIRVG